MKKEEEGPNLHVQPRKSRRGGSLRNASRPRLRKPSCWGPRRGRLRWRLPMQTQTQTQRETEMETGGVKKLQRFNRPTKKLPLLLLHRRSRVKSGATSPTAGVRTAGLVTLRFDRSFQRSQFWCVPPTSAQTLMPMPHCQVRQRKDPSSTLSPAPPAATAARHHPSARSHRNSCGASTFRMACSLISIAS